MNVRELKRFLETCPDDAHILRWAGDDPAANVTPDTISYHWPSEAQPLGSVVIR